MARKKAIPDPTSTLVIRDTRIDPDHLMLEGVNLASCPKCRGKGEVQRRKGLAPGSSASDPNPEYVYETIPCSECDATGETEVRPLYTVGEVAKVFFARTGHWVRWREGDGFFSLDGQEAGTRTEHGARSYDLADVERMAHALASRGKITPVELLLVLNAVRAEAMIYGFILP